MAYQTGPPCHFDYRSRQDSDYFNFHPRETPKYSDGWGQNSQNLNRNYMHQKGNDQNRFHREEENYNDTRRYTYQATSFGSVRNQSYHTAGPFCNRLREQANPRSFLTPPPNGVEDGCTITEEELESLFNGMVIFCFLSKENVFLKKDQIIRDSFLRSGIPGEINFDFNCHPERRNFTCCTVVWQNRALAHGSGTSRLGAQKRAASCLLDKLSEICFTVKAKPEYYTIDGYRKKLYEREVPGVYRIVNKRDAPDTRRAFEFIDHFFIEDTDCELVFTFFEGFSEFELIIRHAKLRGLEYLYVPLSHVSVFKTRSAQYWRDKLLNCYNMENEKFQLEPPLRLRLPLPQGINNKNLVSQAMRLEESTKLNKKLTAKKRRILKKREKKQKAKNKLSASTAAEGKDPTSNEPTQQGLQEKAKDEPDDILVTSETKNGPTLNEPTQHSSQENAKLKPKKLPITLRLKNGKPLMTKKVVSARLKFVEEAIKAGKPLSKIREFEFLSAKQKSGCLILERAWAKYYAKLKTSQSQSTCATNR